MEDEHAHHRSVPKRNTFGETARLPYASWSDGVAIGATYTLQVGLAAPPVPIGRYFVILQVDAGGSRHLDDAASMRAIPFFVTTDLDTQLGRIDALYASRWREVDVHLLAMGARSKDG